MVDDTSSPDLNDLAALDFFAPPGGQTASDLDALGDTDMLGDGPQQDDGEPLGPTFTVTNPPGTVSVSTFMDGRVHRLELSQKVTTMTEADLADEIVIIARLATEDARAAQYAFMLESMRQQGHDDVTTRDFLSRDLKLPSPEDAIAAKAQIFTTRYAGEE